MPEDSICKVDESLLISSGVGLISVSDGHAEIVLSAKKEKPISQMSYNYSTECFCDQAFRSLIST